MIKKQELRLGSLVKQGIVEVINSTSAFCYVPKKGQSIAIKLDGNYIEFENIEPIKITDDILNMLSINLIDWFGEGSYMLVKDEEFGHCFKVRNASHTHEIEFGYFKYLHQLQNYYFDLTGKELEFEKERGITIVNVGS